MKKKCLTVQEWVPFENLYDKGIIKLKNQSYVKLIKVNSINYTLKSDMEKESILNSYKLFLKTCNFNIQILVQSKKENISDNLKKIKEINKSKNSKIKVLSENYIQYVKSLNQNSKSSSKNFYIIIKKSNLNNEKNIIEELNENFYKIKECLSRCGNSVIEIESKTELKNIIYSFYNPIKYFNGGDFN